LVVTVLLVILTTAVYFHYGEENYEKKRLWILSFLHSSYISYVVLKPTTLALSPIHLHPVYPSHFTALQPILKLLLYVRWCRKWLSPSGLLNKIVYEFLISHIHNQYLWFLFVISDFRREVAENSALLCYYAASRDNLYSPFKDTRNFRKRIDYDNFHY
jgi:hypothetical protein